MRINFFTKTFFTLSLIILFSGLSATSSAAEKALNDYNAIPATETGSYLAARFAQSQHDHKNAYKFMARSLSFSDDPTIGGLLDKTFLLAVSKGDIPQAMHYTPLVIEDGENMALGHILTAVTSAKNNDFSKTSAALNKIDTSRFGAYTVPLLQAWAYLGAGHYTTAENLLKTSKYADDPNYLLHRALMADSYGDNTMAENLYRQALKTGLPVQESLLAANFFLRNDQVQNARHIINKIAEKHPQNMAMQNLNRYIKNNQAPAPEISNASDGLSYTLLAMANLLHERQANESALIYARMVEYLHPENPGVNIIMGDIMAENQMYSRALYYYTRVPETASHIKTAQLRTVEIMEKTGKTNGALAFLNELADKKNTRLEALTYIGDIHQRAEKYEQARAAYDAAIAELGEGFTARHWSLMYARGMANERLNNWPAAEQDLLTALEYTPNNPAVLNYLGYSWIEKDMHTDRALKMLKKAVALKPQDGYILDSYGWALYKTGQYDKAVNWLEKAVEIHPEDVVLNHHLGDAYWQNGRHKEARYQWRRALRYSKDPAIKTSLQEKLHKGIAPVTAKTTAREAALHDM